MKKINLIEWLSRNSHEKQSPQRFGRYAVMLLMLLTLGVGQMWAAPWVKNDVSTGKQGTKTVGDKLNGGSDWWYNYQTNGGWSSGTDIQVLIGTSTSSYSTVTASWYEDSGDNKKVHANIGSFVFDKSGIWYAVGKYYAASTTAYTSGTSFTSNTSLSTSMNTSNSPYWEVTPPTVKSFSVSTTGSDILSGTGTSADPYIIAYNGSLVLTLSGSKNKTDANSSLQYNTAGTWNSTTSRTISSITSTTKTSVTVKMRCYNSTASLSGTESSKQIYYQSEDFYSVTAAKTPSAGGSVTPSSATNMGVTSGGTITADPNDGYTFSGWSITSGSGTIEDDSEESTTFYPEEASTVTATFEETMSTVSFVASPTGKGTFTVGGSTVTSTEAGVTTTKSVTAVPISGYRFAGWSITGGATISSTSDNPTTVTGKGAGADATLTATFEEDLTYYTLTYGAGSSPYNNGSVSAVNASTSAAISSGSSVLSGTSVQFTATPSTHYKLTGWYSDAACESAIAGAGTTNPYTKVISATQGVYAKFEIKQCSITLDRNGGTSGSTSVTATHGSTLPSFTAHGRTGYTLQGYYTAESGGTKIIDAVGALVASTSYADANKKWNNDATSLTLYAQWSENLTTVTINVSPASTGTLTVGGGAFTPGNTTTAGVTTSRTVVATAANDYVFSSWGVAGNATGTSSTNTYTLKGNGSGSTGTLTANFTLIPCKLYKVSAAKNGSTTDKGAMSYDATEHAYYKDITTDASPYYFRFYYNSSAQYCTDWKDKYDGGYTSGKHVSANSSKETCDQSVGGWGDKPAMYYSGASGTTIRIWFDFQNKKVWITADKDKQYVLRGSKYDDSGNGGLDGWGATTSYLVGLSSGNTGTITRTLNAYTKYKIKLYDLYSPDWMGNTSTSSETTMTNGTLYTMYSGDSYKNFVFTTTAAGTYTFTLDKTSGKKIKVDYPTAYTVTYYNKLRDIDGTITTATTGGSITGMTGSASGARTSGQYFNNTETVTLTHSAENGGYTWIGWYNSEECSSAYSAGGNVTINNVSRTIALSNLAANTKVAALYAEVGTTVTLANDGHGHVEIGGATVTTTTVGKTTSRTIVAVNASGYHFNAWTATSGTDYTIGNTGNASTSLTGKGSGSSSQTVTATFTPNNYTVTLKKYNGDDDEIISVTYDANTNLTSAVTPPTKTGYTFGGYFTGEGGAGDQLIENDGDWIAGNDTIDAGGNWVHAGNVVLHAKWTANPYTITLDVDEANKGTTTGATTSVTATYNATMPAIGGSLPTGANGYRYMGMYTNQNGEGVALTDSLNNWKSNVTDYISSGTWVNAGNITLYAYYKKAEITALTLDAAIVETNGTVGVTPTISPKPEGDTKICFNILHSNDNPLASQPEISWDGTKATFDAGETSGTYKIAVSLRTGTSCGGGTLLDSSTVEYQVAGTHNVTLRYQCGDDVIQDATILGGIRPLDWSENIVAPEIFGYTFSRWIALDGVTINGCAKPDTCTNETIQIKAVYDGKLKAEYTQKQIIYFKNTLGWSTVYVNFYTASEWDDSDNGSGYKKGCGNKGVTNRNKTMTRIGETDVWYYDYGYNGGGSSITPTAYISFTDKSRDNVDEFWAEDPGINVVYPANYADAISTDKTSETGFKAATPMFVPISTQTPVTVNRGGTPKIGWANYYNAGYWTKYTPGTGYTLEIYNSEGNSLLKSVEFTSEDDLMPMKAVVDLEASPVSYKFQIRRGGTSTYGVYYGNEGTMTYANHGQATPWAMTNSPFTMAGITPNAAGDYTFNLSYSPNASSEYRLRVKVDYPIVSGDYRVIYKDNVHSAFKPSAIVTKSKNVKDTVSFFIRPGQSPVMKIQKSTVASNGTISWSDYSTVASETLTGLPQDSVYNICLTMDADSAISVEKVEAYTGNFYIRTDAANSRWDNYRSDPDHLMVFSEYSITHGGYSHYNTHWVDKDDSKRKNVKFCIANDYSPCISDTLIRETASGEWANINNYIGSTGDLSRSANVRFMWNRHDNTIKRAYVDGAQGDGSDNFLYMLNVEAGADKIKKGDGTALTDHKVTFSDKGNWIYEANIQAQPNAAIRLLSNWGTENTITQYFKGTSSTTEKLIGGSGTTWYDIRILYDYKTNRLISSFVPADENITSEKAIEADIMFIREGQGDIAQLTFGEDGKISKIETAYGVLRFNKWTLNNKSKEGGHSPLASPASIYERSLYWISFPFRVKLSEVIGFGTYGIHWAVQRYDGADRAARGNFIENGGFWKWMNRNTEYLEPNQGYLLAIDVDLLGESSDLFKNTEQIELYFPSFGKMPDITDADVVQHLDTLTCTINWHETRGLPDTGNPRTSYNRTIFDSHWHVMSVPTYVNTDDVTFANTTWTSTVGPNFLYTWNADDNTITATTASGYTYHAMHAYMVQYAGKVTWSAKSGSPAAIVARRTYAEKPSKVEFRLELQQNEKMIDRTYVALSSDEEVSADFKFGEDMTKEFNAGKANIYTKIGYLGVAGNTLPMTEQTTIVPVGVEIKTNGEYTFSIPDGTEGIGVTLIDNETGVRTSLSAIDYTVALTAGDYVDRFVLEISPIKETPTGIEQSPMTNDQSQIKKVMIDGILYIVKDGKMYDARGSRVQ